jgi:hypothetical protein
LPANAVEIGLSPRALAALLVRSAAETAAWTAGQRARTGRECVVSGQRGSFPAGLAFGSRRELAAFLDAWREFARPQPSTAILEGTRIEKAAEDAGFDLTPAQEGSWLVFASSAFAHRLGVRAPGAEAYRVGFSQAGWGTKAAGDCASALEGGAAPRAGVTEVTGYDILHALLRRAGRIAHLLAGEFACASAALPSATEVERLTIQRVGQDIFRHPLDVPREAVARLSGPAGNLRRGQDWTLLPKSSLQPATPFRVTLARPEARDFPAHETHGIDQAVLQCLNCLGIWQLSTGDRNHAIDNQWQEPERRRRT